jgi:hypothetical protein
MTPTWSLVAHQPPTAYGDCLRAALASVLDLPAEDVPHFAHDGADPEIVLQRARDYLRPMGLTAFVSIYDGSNSRAEVLEYMAERNPDTTYLLFGLVSEGGGHVVVCTGGKVVHNPAWYGCHVVAPGPSGWITWVVART